jgi:hypothetical protein
MDGHKHIATWLELGRVGTTYHTESRPKKEMMPMIDPQRRMQLS